MIVKFVANKGKGRDLKRDLPFFNPFTSKSDQHLISPYNVTL